jgi:hypothetical protein
MARLHGRSPRGTRARARRRSGTGRGSPCSGALGAEGIVGAMGVEAATSAAVFHAYLDQALLPELRRSRPDAVLVMHNLPAHKAPRVRALLDRSGFGYRYLPACSPDLNPVRGTAPNARLGQGEGRVAPRRRPHRGRAARSTRPGPGRHHPAARRGVLPPLRLQPSGYSRAKCSRWSVPRGGFERTGGGRERARSTAEEALAKLQGRDVLVSQGKTVADAIGRRRDGGACAESCRDGERGSSTSPETEVVIESWRAHYTAYAPTLARLPAAARRVVLPHLRRVVARARRRSASPAAQVVAHASPGRR